MQKYLHTNFFDSCHFGVFWFFFWKAACSSHFPLSLQLKRMLIGSTMLRPAGKALSFSRWTGEISALWSRRSSCIASLAFKQCHIGFSDIFRHLNHCTRYSPQCLSSKLHFQTALRTHGCNVSATWLSNVRVRSAGCVQVVTGMSGPGRHPCNIARGVALWCHFPSGYIYRAPGVRMEPKTKLD